MIVIHKNNNFYHARCDYFAATESMDGQLELTPKTITEYYIILRVNYGVTEVNCRAKV